MTHFYLKIDLQSNLAFQLKAISGRLNALRNQLARTGTSSLKFKKRASDEYYDKFYLDNLYLNLFNNFELNSI